MSSSEGQLLAPVRVRRRAVADYERVAGRRQLAELRARAAPLSGLRVLHLTMSWHGAPVATYVRALTELMLDLGIASEWLALRDAGDIDCARHLRDVLVQPGSTVSSRDWSSWISLNFRVARELDGWWDACVVHDLALAGVAAIGADRGGAWLRCAHRDPARLSDDAAGRLAEYDDAYACTVLEQASDALTAYTDRACVVAPAIDPLAPARVDLEPGTREATCRGIGLDPRRPLVLAVAPNGLSAGVLEAIEAYRCCRRAGTDVQLAVALDDVVRGGATTTQALAMVHADPDLHMFTTLSGSGLNALRSAATLVLALDEGDGFDAEVLEGLWKQRPVIVRRAAAVPAGLREAVTVVAGGAEPLARAILEVVGDASAAHERARIGHRAVREDFLLPRAALDWLRLLDEATTAGTAVTSAPPARAEQG